MQFILANLCFLSTGAALNAMLAFLTEIVKANRSELSYRFLLKVFLHANLLSLVIAVFIFFLDLVFCENAQDRIHFAASLMYMCEHRSM